MDEIDTYEYVLAEQVADWMMDRRMGKGYFENNFSMGGGLSPEGLLLCRYVLKHLRAEFRCLDYSTVIYDEVGGNTERTALFLKDVGPDDADRVYASAEEAVRKYHSE